MGEENTTYSRVCSTRYKASTSNFPVFLKEFNEILMKICRNTLNREPPKTKMNPLYNKGVHSKIAILIL